MGRGIHRIARIGPQWQVVEVDDQARYPFVLRVRNYVRAPREHAIRKWLAAISGSAVSTLPRVEDDPRVTDLGGYVASRAGTCLLAMACHGVAPAR